MYVSEISLYVAVEKDREPEEFGYEEEERPKRKQKQQHKEITHSELK